jgi:acyl-CoA thioester hydrolase
MIHTVRVIYGDTDQMGVVYYANYLRYFEASRAAYLRELGRSNADLVRWGVALPVAESHCRYRLPAHYEDLLDVHVHVEDMRGASMHFVYTVRRGEDVIAEGYTVHACVSVATGRPVRFPGELRALIEGDGAG